MYFKVFGSSPVPLKCGTRYFGQSDLPFIKNIELWDLLKSNILIDSLIVREPIDYFKSALHTDTIRIINMGLSQSELNKHMNDMLMSYYSMNLSGHHYSVNVHKILYLFWRNSNTSIELVDINDLSDWITTKTDKTLSYQADNYWFKDEEIWFDKDWVYNWVSINFKTHWDGVMDSIEREYHWYTKLINNEKLPISFI
jgi:hypothetical protein